MAANLPFRFNSHSTRAHIISQGTTENLSDADDPLTPGSKRDNTYFSTERLKSGLGARTARGGAVTFASQGFKFLAGIGTTMVLGRLLTPGDYGLVGMVAVVTGFVSMFKDLGLSASDRAE